MRKEINPDKLKALDKAIAGLDKQFGKGTAMKLGDAPIVDIEVIPTGSLLLNRALGVGGYPRGRIVEIYGPESSGKTTLTLHAVAEAQKLGGLCAFVDAEHALDPKYAEALGVDIANLVISQPDTGEQGLDVVEALVKSGALDLIVVDSVAALVPKAEIEGEMGQAFIGIHARLMSQALRKLAGIVHKTNTTVIFINQIREKVGVMFGSPEVTTGGRALKFYASVRLDIRRKEAIKKGDEILGNRTKVKVVKNKVAPPFREVEFEIMYGKGIDAAGELVDAAVADEIIKKAGAWFSYGELRWQGKENTKEGINNDPALFNELMNKVNGEKLVEEVGAVEDPEQDIEPFDI